MNNQNEKDFFNDCVSFYQGKTTVHALRSNMTCYGVTASIANKLDAAAFLQVRGYELPL